jgi:citrate synthase
MAQAALALGVTGDALAYDLRPRAVAQTGWRIIWQLAAVATGGEKAQDTIDATLAKGWGVARSAHLIRAALILCADHELNVSTFTARCVASAGTSPYGVVVAGLAALEGTKHGGTTARIEASWDTLRRTRDLEIALAERLRRGEPIDGFGHPLYPHGDPRGTLLLEMLPAGKTALFARRLASAGKSVLGEAPTVDFALVAMARALGLPSGAALTLFAIGRTLGWIGHAIEQYEKDAIIRPRAKYVGVLPANGSP